MPSGPRIRSNSEFGTITDNPLAAGGTTFSSARLALFPVVSSAHAVVTLDPRALNGEPEIVIVTAHTAAAITATITRGAYGTVARSHPNGTEWISAPLDEDFIEVLTSGTRPSDPYEGQLIFETDTNKLVGYGGTDWAPRDAGGQLGYAQVVANQDGILAGTNLTGLSVAVTVGTGRRVRITGHIGQFVRTAGTATFVALRAQEGATVLANETIGIPGNLYNGGTVMAVVTPTAGAHTYHLTGESDGTVRLAASATQPSFILVEDIGAA